MNDQIVAEINRLIGELQGRYEAQINNNQLRIVELEGITSGPYRELPSADAVKAFIIRNWKRWAGLWGLISFMISLLRKDPR